MTDYEVIDIDVFCLSSVYANYTFVSFVTLNTPIINSYVLLTVN